MGLCRFIYIYAVSHTQVVLCLPSVMNLNKLQHRLKIKTFK